MAVLPVDATSVNAVSHLIQIAVAPVFLLAAVGAILNVFTGRLSRIVDKIERLDRQSNEWDSDERERRDSLANRMANMNLAILFATITGLLVASVIMIIFSSALLKFDDSLLIAILFIVAMLSFILSLTVFLKEIFLTAKSAEKLCQQTMEH